MPFIHTAEEAENLVLPTDDELMLCHNSFYLSSFSFRQFIFRWPTLPQGKQLGCSLLSLFAFFGPLILLDVIVIARH